MQVSKTFRRSSHPKCREQSAQLHPDWCYYLGLLQEDFMGQLGFQELLIIFVIALLVFGPKKLPELGKSLGKGLREFKKATEDLKSNWEDQMKEVEQPLKDTAKDIESTSKEVTNSFSSDLSQSVTPSEPAVPKEHV
jgi:TatA/E family protein of Tat protein translocase